MSHYYNEHDPKAAAWLRELMKQNLIPSGEVDERSIADVRPSDLTDFTSCHFFAGIGGWPLTMRLAGWPDNRPVWTGSCPCQPFSSAGKGLGEKDPRHLWPEFLRLITACAPATVFGEQVASAAGRVWLAGVRTDLEALAYEVGAADLCAAGIGAPHIRQRIFWYGSLSGWPTPTTRDHKDGDSTSCRNVPMNGLLGRTVHLAGWRSPDHSQRGGCYSDPAKALARLTSGHQINLEDQACLAGWTTPQAMEPHAPMRPSRAATGRKTDYLGRQVLGVISTSFPASTEKRGALNPAHSRWLMGYPAEWDSCGATAMQSCRSSRRSSSARVKKPANLLPEWAT